MAATLIVPDGKVAITVSSAWLPDSISDKQNKAGKLHMRPKTNAMAHYALYPHNKTNTHTHTQTYQYTQQLCIYTHI